MAGAPQDLSIELKPHNNPDLETNLYLNADLTCWKKDSFPLARHFLSESSMCVVSILFELDNSTFLESNI